MSTNADRQRRYRERKGARVGQGPGPAPSQPCGTLAAYRRHTRRGEPIDDACRLAYNAAQRDYYARRKSSG